MISKSDQSLTENWLTPAFFANPYTFYDELRSIDPVHWSDKLNGWVITGYGEVVSVLRDSRIFTSAGRMAALLDAMPESERANFELVYNHFSAGLIRCDPPDHTRLRTLVGKVFTPKAIENTRPHVQTIVTELLDAVASMEQMDVVGDFAYPLPATIICEMLGVPLKDTNQVRTWSEGINSVIAGVLPIRQAAEQMQKALLELRAYYTELIAQRRQRPRDDLLSLLVAAEEQGDRLNMEELLSTAENLLAAGHETTTSLIGNGVLTLLRHPEQLELIRQKSELMPAAVEEILRYESPLQRQTRVVKDDVEFHGKQMRKGQIVFAMVGAANRDPLVFRDPNRFDILREENRHIAFGFGIHFCLGAPLARLEAPLALDAIFRRFPGLHLATATIEWKPTAALRGLKSLPVFLR